MLRKRLIDLSSFAELELDFAEENIQFNKTSRSGT